MQNVAEDAINIEKGSLVATWAMMVYAPPSLSVARKKKKFKTKALHCVFIWCMDTLNPENKKNSMSLFWEIAILSLLPYKARSTTRGRITKGSTLHFDGIQVQTI